MACISQDALLDEVIPDYKLYVILLDYKLMDEPIPLNLHIKATSMTF